MDVEVPGEGAKDAGFTDLAIGESAVRGFLRILENEGWPATLFVVPQAAQSYRPVLIEYEAKGFEMGLHLHAEDLGHGDRLGSFSYEDQIKIIETAMDQWSQVMGHRPFSFRPGNFSANDTTFPALAALGFRQGSVSAPERKMISLRAVWTGAPKDPHFAHKANRLLAGDLSFLEVPVTVDWETMIWGGITPLDLRIEAVDARSHMYTIEKNLKRMIEGKVFPRTLVPMTHNFFDYSDDAEFRTITLRGMIAAIKSLADKYDLQIHALTLGQFRDVFERIQ
jgi:peptidoglycan/xylan/chitin deacetylase (PgdA/CDA1 family)